MHEKKWKYELMYLAENDCSSTVLIDCINNRKLLMIVVFCIADSINKGIIFEVFYGITVLCSMQLLIDVFSDIWC